MIEMSKMMSITAQILYAYISGISMLKTVNRWVLRQQWNTSFGDYKVTSCFRLFPSRAAAAGKALLLLVACSVCRIVVLLRK